MTLTFWVMRENPGRVRWVRMLLSVYWMVWREMMAAWMLEVKEEVFETLEGSLELS